MKNESIQQDGQQLSGFICGSSCIVAFVVVPVMFILILCGVPLIAYFSHSFVVNANKSCFEFLCCLKHTDDKNSSNNDRNNNNNNNILLTSAGGMESKKEEEEMNNDNQQQVNNEEEEEEVVEYHHVGANFIL
ncbi:hypothetical protein ABK040_010736 [Willaertia magna]